MNELVLRSSRESMRRNARTFSLAAAFLPADRRDEAAVIYALCRRIDDLGDEDGDRVGLERLRAELEGREPACPLVAEFLAISKRSGVPVGPALHLIDGVQSDLGTVRMTDDADLLRYCYRVAGTVGLLMCAVLGVEDRAAWPHAVDLGIGMQLTNICRDVAEDAAMGRIYLPESRLRAAGVEPGHLLDGSADRAAVASVVRDLLALADRYYASGDEGLQFLPARTRFAIRVASRTYRAIGDELARRGHDALAGRAVVPPVRKGLQVLLALRDQLRYPARQPHDAALHRALMGLPGADEEGA